ncbi:methylaspartate ammonia-lyase [Microvirga antarctica]|uniref:methylaspartate ammonia-lyase n=1 Tax=Microvirga antarctica TaxID=2819233 RepID=UPI001B30A97F|nr:methylaspartate ammonia-lyase [Microvirga antarctica]
MRIADALFSLGLSGYVHRDLAAIKGGAVADGMLFAGKPVSPGFRSIVEACRTVSIMLVLEDGQVAFGDCADVILAGIGGRDPAFHGDDHLALLTDDIRPWLIGRDAREFRINAEEIDRLTFHGVRSHTAIRYGASQALLHAASLSGRCTMAEVIADQYGSTLSTTPLKLLASCERDDQRQLDRMILKQVDLLPHASFTIADQHVGLDGGKLLDFVSQVSKRIAAIGAPGYHPRIHVDVYGTLGEVFPNPEDLVAYLGTLRQAARPYELIVESPVIAGSREEQIATLKTLRTALSKASVAVELIADEWCNGLEDVRAFAEAGAADYLQIKTPDLGGITNTIEALLHCRQRGVGACLGGTANETDQSARITAHIGLACGADFMLTKPGLGGDEGLMIVTNEMARSLELIRARPMSKRALTS